MKRQISLSAYPASLTRTSLSRALSTRRLMGPTFGVAITMLGTIALACCLAAGPASAQDRASDPANSLTGSVTIQESPASPVNPGASNDPAPPQDQNAQNTSTPPRSSAAVPNMLTLQEGTVITVRINQWLSSDRNRPGDTFTAVLEQPLLADGWVVARRGQLVTGRISAAQKTAHGKDASLGLELSELTLVDGQQLPVSTQLVPYAGRPRSPNSNQRDAATIAATTIVGAGIGAAVGGGTGAAIGAGVGVMVGATGVVLGHGKPAVVPPESLLTFRLQEPLDISTERSQVAFRPVTQGDYDRPTRDQDAYARPHAPGRTAYPTSASPYAPAYPPPAYYVDYPYFYPWGWGYYPPAYLGFYGSFGPRFVGGFGRGGFRR
jgi:hypothetical protein